MLACHLLLQRLNLLDHLQLAHCVLHSCAVVLRNQRLQLAGPGTQLAAVLAQQGGGDGPQSIQQAHAGVADRAVHGLQGRQGG